MKNKLSNKKINDPLTSLPAITLSILPETKLSFGRVPSDSNPGEVFAVIVKVREPNYVPAGFQVRIRIDEEIFTALCDVTSLAKAEKDVKVVSISPAKRLSNEVPIKII